MHREALAQVQGRHGNIRVFRTFNPSWRASCHMQKITGDHNEIKGWAENLGGKPTIIDHPLARADKIGIRIDFPGESHEILMSETRPATWDEFFQVFEDQGLLLSYEDVPKSTDPTEWYRFEKRDAPPE
jgi:hypothetical protein